jgi:hypothetical protein
MKRLASVAGAVVVMVVVLNVIGIARYPGGPLREPDADGPLWLDAPPPADQGSSTVGNTPDADWATTDTDMVFTILNLEDSWPWPATIESVTPVNATEGLLVTEARIRRISGEGVSDLSVVGPVGPEQRAILDNRYVALPAEIGAGEAGRNVALVFRTSDPGPATFDALAIDYRVGPFSFRVVHHLGLDACMGATPAERICPEDDE